MLTDEKTRMDDDSDRNSDELSSHVHIIFISFVCHIARLPYYLYVLFLRFVRFLQSYALSVIISN